MKGCTFETNTATEAGGAIWMDGGVGTIENCTFKTNQVLRSTYYAGTGGGALGAYSTNTGTLSIKNCQFVGNVTTGSGNYGNGGAVYLQVNATTTVDGCSFIGNTANAITGDAIRGGGALNLAYNNAAKTTIVKNCIFRDNKLTTTTPETSNGEVQGSALLLNTATTVQNCIFANNSSTGIGSTVFIKVNGCNIFNSVFARNLTTGSGRALNTLTRTSVITNCLFWGNSLASPAITGASSGTTGTYNAYDTDESGQTGYYGTGSIKTLTASNTFVSPTSSTGANTDLTVGAAADWSLKSGCPAINAGTNSSGVTTDILGNARPSGSAYDMGAYEYGYTTAQTITFGALSAKTYGDASFTLGATSSSGLTVSYASSNTAVATVSGNTVTIVGAGSTNITASQAGNGSFTAASNVVQGLTVNTKTLTLTTPAASSKTYTGTNAAVVSGTLSGIVNSDAVTCTSGTFASVNVGSPIAVTCILSGAKAGNYTLTQPGITANITAAPLTITGISGVNKVYTGTNAATLTGTAAYSGLVNGETPTVTGTASATFNSVNVADGIGITITGYTAPNSNYSLTSQPSASANITAAPLTITGLSGVNKVYDGTNTASLSGTPAYSGLVNGETPTVTGTASATFNSVNVANGISITITGYTAPNSNYSLTSQPSASADITQASQTISFGALPTGKIVGDADFAPGATSATSGTNAITYSSSNTDVATIVDSQIHIVGAGSTTITASQASSTNYSAATSVDQGLTILAASVTVLADANLSTYSPTSATDVTVNAGYELTVDDNFSVKSMTVAPGAKLTLASGKTLTVVGAFTLQSDATGTATFINNGGTITAASTKVEQYLNGARNWYICSPISNGSTAAFNPAGGSNHLFWYDESKGSTTPWSYSTRNDSSLQVMRGYVANMSTSGAVTFTGSLNSTGSITLHRTAGQVKEGFNLVGNPYPAHTTITKTITDAANALNTIWYRTATWDAVHSKYVYTFQTCLLNANGSYLGTPDTTTPIIAPMQAFWVRTNVDGTTLDFSAAAQSHQSSNLLKAPAASNLSQEMLRLQVTNSDAIADETVLYFNPDASNVFDSYDAQKMFNNSASVAEIFTVAGNENLAINGLNAIQYDTEMPLGFNTVAAGTFSIKASQIANFTAGTQLILKDYADVNSPVTTDLSDGSSYSFSSVATSNNTSRFALIFRAPSVTTGINNESNDNVWISTRNGQLLINGAGNGATLEVFNAVGQKVISKNLTGTNVQGNNNLAAGAYLVKLTNEGKSITRKIIID